jgi:hypothetical protein
METFILHRYFLVMQAIALRIGIAPTVFTSIFFEKKEKAAYPLSIKLLNLCAFDNREQLEQYCNSFGLDIIDHDHMGEKFNTASFHLSRSNVLSSKSFHVLLVDSNRN